MPASASMGAPASSGLNLAATPRYQAERVGNLEQFLDRIQRLVDETSLPFHHPNWLRAWYSSLGQVDGRKPLLLAVCRQGSAPGDTRDALLLPLVQRRHRGQNWVEYADAGVVDYVGPLVAHDWAGGAAELDAAQAVWQAARRALSGNDVLRIEKLLAHGLKESGQHANPLVLALPALPSHLFGNEFEVHGDWDGWRRSLDKRVRKEIERCWRVFQRSPVARFERISDPAQAMALFEVLERQQSQRLAAVLGNRYRLDQRAYQTFYRQLLASGLADGSVVLTALFDGEHVVSALLGVANRHRYIGLRQSLGGDAWKSCSPGRLLDEQTARHMHETGHSSFDFGVGNYFHKTTLQMAQIPLLELCVALSWRGWPAVLAFRAKHWLKRRPVLMAGWRRLQGVLA